MNKTLP